VERARPCATLSTLAKRHTGIPSNVAFACRHSSSVAGWFLACVPQAFCGEEHGPPVGCTNPGTSLMLPAASSPRQSAIQEHQTPTKYSVATALGNSASTTRLLHVLAVCVAFASSFASSMATVTSVLLIQHPIPLALLAVLPQPADAVDVDLSIRLRFSIESVTPLQLSFVAAVLLLTCLTMLLVACQLLTRLLLYLTVDWSPFQRGGHPVSLVAHESLVV